VEKEGNTFWAELMVCRVSSAFTCISGGWGTANDEENALVPPPPPNRDSCAANAFAPCDDKNVFAASLVDVLKGALVRELRKKVSPPPCVEAENEEAKGWREREGEGAWRGRGGEAERGMEVEVGCEKGVGEGDRKSLL
jgi:hypothetical protein